MDLNTVNEEWFEAQLESQEGALDELIAVFTQLIDAERGEEAERWARALFQKQVDAGAVAEALQVLEWLAVVRTTVDDVKAAVEKLLSADANALKMVEPAGFGESLPLKTCFERLRHLRAFKPGMLCYNPTWGFGVIEDIDFFYQNIEVDFERKGEHEMAFSYAAEALEALDEDHILAIKHNRPEELEELIRKDPAEVVRMALRSYGAMSVTRLQETLTSSILPESGWKKFWAAARSVLKTDASVDIPKKRSDNIILHKGVQSYDEAWFSRIETERDIETLFDRFKEIIEKSIDISSDAAQASLSNRLTFIIQGAPSARPEWKVGGIIFARHFGIEPEGVDMATLIEEFISGDLITTLERLPSRQLQHFLDMLLESRQEDAVKTMSKVVPAVSYTVLGEVIGAMLKAGAEEQVRELLSGALARRKASAPMLLWCQRAPEQVAAWDLIAQNDLAFRIQEVLERNLSGDMLRAQNQLRERFQEEGWLHDVMGSMTPQQRRDFLRRIHEGHGWDVLDRKSVVAKVLRKFPDLQDIILPPKNSQTPKRETPKTSSRSYAERQRQLERIMTVEIPENSKEIELARSYGDLRENAEFKYAKERQGLLMAQGAQLAEDLEKVKPTDFVDIPTESVAAGTGVELVYPDGSEEIYYILGVWDQNEALSVISSDTALAKALLDHTPGDQVTIPSGTCEIRRVIPLSGDVRSWIDG